MKKTIGLILFLITTTLINTTLGAANHEDHAKHDHSMMGSDANQAMGMGVIHLVDAENKSVNLTHQPIPSLNWPAMTMDLPVTKRVDLSGFKPGDKVHFTLKKGRDNQFRILTMEPAE
ncbi:MAG: copper-binding protein [Candidatus Thiodiazotropha sp. DIVDIV]